MWLFLRKIFDPFLKRLYTVFNQYVLIFVDKNVNEVSFMALEKNRAVTQNDVAREAGVTRSMVSYVISGSNARSVAPETRERILQAIEKLGYRPNKAAQELQQGKEAFAKKQIGVVLCDANVFLRPYYAEIVSGIHTAAHENKFDVHFIHFFDELRDPVLFNRIIHPEEIGSLILVATKHAIRNDSDLKLIEAIKEKIPQIVCVEWKCDGLTSVTFDLQETARKAASYLFSKGYEDVAYIGEEDERVAGVRLAFIENGIAGPGDGQVVPAFTMEGGFYGAKTLEEKRGFPRAIVCGSDEVAIGVLCYLNEKKIKIPEEVAVISIDNIESAAFTTPPLTTMNVQKRAMGVRAVEMIVGGTALQGDKSLCISLPTSIVERSSC